MTDCRIKISEPLHKALRVTAFLRGISLTVLAEEMLEESLERFSVEKKAEKTHDGDGDAD